MKTPKHRHTVVLTMGLLALVFGGQATAQTLHTNAAEAQAVGEMRARLKSALASGNPGACQREGENLARYKQAAAGESVISADLAAVQRRLQQISQVYDYLRQIHDLNAKKAVTEAYTLIRDVQGKLVNDALVNVTAALVTAPMPLLGQMLVQMETASEDFLGSYADASSLVNRAAALRGLEKMARHADEQMKSLIPAARQAEELRTLLIRCARQYQDGVVAAQGTGPSASSAAPSAHTVWAGRWHLASAYTAGALDLTQSGSSVSGSYENGVLAGQIQGSLSGNTLSGTWTDPNSKNSGPFKWVIDTNGRSFSGYFTWQGQNHGWNGSR